MQVVQIMAFAQHTIINKAIKLAEYMAYSCINSGFVLGETAMNAVMDNNNNTGI